MPLATDIGFVASPLLRILGVDHSGERGRRRTGSIRLAFDTHSRVL
jgi:hypothetical protein